MFCVKCGREAAKGEKRCPDCGMRLVTPAKLKELIELEKYVNLTFSGKLRNWYKRFKKRWKRRFVIMGEALGVFFSRLWVDLKALCSLLGRLIKAGAIGLWKFLKRAGAFLWKYTVIGSKGFWAWLKRSCAALKARYIELREQYRQEQERQLTAGTQKQRSGAPAKKPQGTAARPAASTRAGTAKTGARGEGASGAKPRSAAPARIEWTSAQRDRNTMRAYPGERKPDRSKLKKTAKGKRKVKPRVFSREWAGEHLRSIVAMSLLVLALIVFAFWGAFSDSGQKTFAQVGLGSARGYLLIGDDYMERKNYSRAVEYYYTSLTKELSYEAALKLAGAYSYLNDTSKEVAALMICIENYPNYQQPYTQLYLLYPNEQTRPAQVQRAIEQGLSRFGSL